MPASRMKTDEASSNGRVNGVHFNAVLVAICLEKLLTIKQNEEFSDAFSNIS